MYAGDSTIYLVEARVRDWELNLVVGWINTMKTYSGCILNSHCGGNKLCVMLKTKS